MKTYTTVFPEGSREKRSFLRSVKFISDEVSNMTINGWTLSIE